MFEPEVFRKQIYGIEEKTCDIAETFRRPTVIRRTGHCAALVTPPGVTLRIKVRSCEIRRALNVEPLLRIKISQLRLATLVRPCIQNAPQKTGEASPAG